MKNQVVGFVAVVFGLLSFAFAEASLGNDPLASLQEVDLDVSSSPHSTRLGAREISLPLQSVNELPTVEITINEKGPFRFHVDLGANVIAISPKVAKELKLSSIAKAILDDSEKETSIYLLNNIKMADATFSSSPAVEVEWFDNVDVDGVLGFNLFKEVLLTLDFPADRLRLSKGKLGPADGKQRFSYSESLGGCPSIPIAIDGRKIDSAVIDTGADDFLVIPKSSAGQFRFHTRPRDGGVVDGPQLKRQNAQSARLEGSLAIGKYTFENPMVTIHEMQEPEILIGSKLLRQFSIKLDQRNRLIEFSKLEQKSKPMKLESEIDRYLAPYVDMRDFSGTVLISKGGEILINKGFGYADVEHGIRHSPQSRIHIASLSKTFTAAAVLRLVDKGKLALDDTLQKFKFDTKHDITIRHLLSHQSGIPDFWNLDGINDVKMKKHDVSDLTEWIMKQPLDFEPGKKHQYSNSGYLVLARIVEIVTGMGFEEALSDLVLKPAGLANTGHLDEARIINNRAKGYDPWLPPNRIVNTDFYDKSLLTGSGSLYSTTGDLLKWYHLVRENDFIDWSKYEYPYGWGKRRIFGRDCIQQSGRNPGCASHISAFLDDDVCIIILSNVQCDAVKNIQRDLSAIVFDQPYKVPEVRKPISVEPASLEPFEGDYKLTDTSMLTVKRFGSALHLKATNGTFLPLEVLGENEFFYRPLYAEIKFERNKSGEVASLLWGGNYACAKLEGHDQSLSKLDGTWIFVEDRTEGRAVEAGGAPMSVKFALRVEKNAVIYPRTRGDERITLDNSVIEKKEDDGSISRYRGEWTTGKLEYTLERTRPGGEEPDYVLRRIFQPTEEGLLVYIISNKSSTKQVALYRHPEDIALPEPAKATIDDMEWLAGVWTGSRSTSSIEERWSPTKGGAMLGVSRTVNSKQRMTAFEYLRIVEREGGLVYVAQPGGGNTTEFTLTELSDQRAVFVNPRHSYPQRIVYEVSEAGALSASIGFAKGRLQRFEFTRQAN